LEAAQVTRLRFPIAVVGAVLISAVLFAFLHLLVSQRGEIGEVQEAVKIEFTRLRQDTEAQRQQEEKVTRERPPQTPDLPQISASSSSAPGDSVSMLTPTVDTSGAMQKMSISAGSDRDIVPLVRIPPDYPARAQQRGIEGWVLVEFTITPSGTVQDPKVLDADPKGMFDDAALKSIARWKYNPKVENGVAVERRGIRVVLRFDLED
jgi:protein TonB